MWEEIYTKLTANTFFWTKRENVAVQSIVGRITKMMEEAVGGRYMKADGKVYVESWPLDIDPDSVKAGDEVRLIVIPE